MLKRLLVIPLALALTAGHSPSRTDEVLDWNAIMTATVAAQNPFAQARFAAITQLAVFEAVNACTERYRPYLGTVNAPAGASAEAVAVSAAHGVLKHYFLGSAAALDGARAQSLAAIADNADGNPRTEADAAWLPLVTTPAFPSYPSAHASASYAAREVAEHLLGTHRIRFEFAHPGVPGLRLSYESFDDLTDDIDDARVFGGIHFRFDQDAGALQGRQVGVYVATQNLRPLRRWQD